MASVSEDNYLFCYSYNLDSEELENIIKETISKLPELSDINYELYINCVCNKDYLKLGYSYIWVSNIEIFNVLLGFNRDGTERIEIIEDENWIKPEIEEPPKGSDWNIIADYNSKITPPTITNYLGPLLNFPPIILTDEEQRHYKNYNQDIELSFSKARIYEDSQYKNSIFSNKVPDWVTNEMLKKFFSKFEKDINTHIKNNNKFTYPIINRKDNNVNIIFSKMNKNTASFVINLVKKTEFKNKDKRCLLFFKQNKKKVYIKNVL